MSPTVDENSVEFRRARTEVLAVARGMGCDPRDVTASVGQAARALTLIYRSFDRIDLEPYARAATLVANYEIPDDWKPEAARNAALQYAVIGTVLAEPMLLAFRRMAHVARARALGARRTAARGADAPPVAPKGPRLASEGKAKPKSKRPKC